MGGGFIADVTYHYMVIGDGFSWTVHVKAYVCGAATTADHWYRYRCAERYLHIYVTNPLHGARG